MNDQLSSNALSFVEQNDFCSTVFLALVLMFVGQTAVAEKPRLRKIGLHCAMLSLLVVWTATAALWQPSDVVDWILLVFRGLAVSGICLGLTWLILALISVLHGLLLRPITRALATTWTTIRNWQARSRAQAKAALGAKERAAAEAKLAPLIAQQQQQAERRNREEQAQRQSCRELRLQCELHYRSRFELLENALPPQRLQELLDTYLSDVTEIAAAEKHARMIVGMIDASAASTGKKFTSIQEIIGYFKEQHAQLENLGLEEDELEALKIYFESGRDKAIETFLIKQ